MDEVVGFAGAEDEEEEKEEEDVVVVVVVDGLLQDPVPFQG